MRPTPLARLMLASTLLMTALSTRAALVELTDVAQLSVGGGYACVVTNSGGAKCWGANYGGQLGDGSTSSRAAAGDVVGLASGVLAIATGKGNLYERSCAVTVAGGVKCWGYGYGPTPVDIAGLSSGAVAVAIGWRHTCALMAGGTVRCWGENESGQLGDGTTMARSSPTQVVSLPAVVQISAGAAHTCALTSAGAPMCWGANESFQLGDATTVNRSTPVAVVGLSGNVAQVAAGGTASGSGYGTSYGGYSCAITASGGAKCWGYNRSGELGDGSNNLRFAPTDVVGKTSGVANISLGGRVAPAYEGCHTSVCWVPLAHTCAVTTAGSVSCWGTGYGNTPFDIAELSSGVQSVSVGTSFTCALTTAGRVRCWGGSYGGSPVAVMSGTTPQTITFGARPTIPVGSAGTLTASASSGLPAALTSQTPAVCTVSTSSSPNILGHSQGVCRIAANQAGNAYFDPAPQAIIDFRIGDPFTQTITFGPAPSVNVGSGGTVSATASSGLSVTFSSNTQTVCTVSGNVVTGVAQGTCTIRARQDGDYWYAPAEATQNTTVGPNNGTFLLAVSKTGSGSGTVTSSPSGIDCGSQCAANFSAGTSVSLAPTAGSDSVFTGFSGACSGTGACTVTTDAAKSVGAAFILKTDIPRLANISTRARVLTGDNVLIAGFVIGGSSPKTVVIRARGPSLAAAGVPNVLVDPVLNLYSGQTVIASNDDWQAAANAATIQSSGFAPSDSRESAIYTTLNPGAYTAIVNGAGGATGNGIVEVFEAGQPEVPLVNVATRGHVSTGNDVMIAGFIIQGGGPQTVVVRARGPSLAQAGVPGVLADPFLQLFSGQTQIQSNDDWHGQVSSGAIQAAGYAPSHPKESAIYITLNPGAYTAIMTGVGGTTGVGIVEVFRVP